MNNYFIEIALNKKLELYFLQLANMIRIRENDVVYIFDEVGTGKTISSGLSIIELLYNNNFKNVLIITDNSVINPFKQKLKNILNLEASTTDYEDIEAEYKIKIINNVYSNLQKEYKKDYDFIIIDEAHLFLNKNTRRYQELTKLNAKKVMFLTATPIKNGKIDLYTYAEIAAYIIAGNKGKSVFEFEKKRLLEKIMWYTCDPEMLCKSFDPYSPVTRYFKDISRNLSVEYNEATSEFIERYEKKLPRRLIPRVWHAHEFNSKFDCIFSNISEIINKNSQSNLDKNRFIIFTGTTAEIDKISKKFEYSNEFEAFHENKISSKKTYLKLSGGLKDKPRISKIISSSDQNENLPTVIITTYQTSEVGIDFPSYNYVINYHINSSASNTEQRFGRIDRMNSIYDELNMCFVVDFKRPDTNNYNFLVSMTDYIYDLLTFLPSKNILITDDTPRILIDEVNSTKDIYIKYKKLCNQENIKAIIDDDNKYHPDIYYHSFKERYKEHIINYSNEFGYIGVEDEICKKINQKIDKDIKDLEFKIEKIKELKKHSLNISNRILYSIDETNSKKKNELYNITTIDSEVVYQEIEDSKRYKVFKSNILELFKEYKSNNS